MDRGDIHHEDALEILKKINETERDVFTTDYIVAETHALIMVRKGHETARLWLRNLTVPIMHASENDFENGKKLVLKHKDKKYSLIDAISFSVMERTGAEDAFAFDAHFQQYGFSVL
ncbi:MAG: PIN domain-containing protein [Deltaproteobacteria bacterium]|nr:PIN domain-containing protein [Deltaproteobacteria bacterium]